MSKRKRIICYIAIAAVYFLLYAGIDYLTQNKMEKSGVFHKWTLPHAQYICRSFQNGDLSLVRDNHFFPFWGAAIFLALTDEGLLQNNAYLFFRLTLIGLLIASNLLGASVLKDRFGERGLYLGGLLGLNPIYFQLLGGTYDQFLFCPLFYCGAMLLIKSETSSCHKWKWRLLSALTLGIAANIRADMTYTYLIYLLLRLRGTTRRVKCQLAAATVVFLLCLVPWASLYYHRSGLFSLASANAGQVAYISLGQGGDYTPWGVVHLDGWDGHEVGRRVKGLKPDYHMSSVFSDPWASKVYFAMFREKIAQHPYDYFRLALRKLRSIVFSFQPDNQLQFGQETSSFAKCLSRLMTQVMNCFNRLSMFILIYCGILFLLRGMKRPLFDIGGVFFIITLTFVSLFQYIDRHLFPLAAFQGVAFLSTITILLHKVRDLVQKVRQQARFDFTLPSQKRVLAMTIYLLPLPLFVFVRYQEAFLGPYRRDRVFADQIKLWEAKGYPKPAGTQWNKVGNFVFSNEGITIDLEKRFKAERLEVSLDHNDRYQISYFLVNADHEQEIVAKQELPQVTSIQSGLAIHAVAVPEEAVKTGYNELSILPIAGDGHFSLGHLRLYD